LRKLIMLLIVAGGLTATLDQVRTLVWTDSVHRFHARPQAVPLHLPPTQVPLAGDAYRPLAPAAVHPSLSDQARAMLDRARDVDLGGGLVAGDLKGGGNGPRIDYRLPQTDVLGGEVRGSVDGGSARLGVHWPHSR
jgi:hypothetical protein